MNFLKLTIIGHVSTQKIPLVAGRRVEKALARTFEGG